MSLDIFNYTIYITTTHFELLPLIGKNELRDYETMKVKEYYVYFIWLGLQVELSKIV